MKRGRLLLILSIGMVCNVHAGVGTWRSYTSMKDVRSVVRVGDVYWAATSGGMFAWQEGSTSYQTYTNAEGLLGNDLTAAGSDAGGNVWSGSSTGGVQVLLTDGSWRYILDIAQSAQTSKRVNRFVMVGDTAFICTDFGLSMFDTRAFLFGDTYTKFGSLSNVRVSVPDVAIYQDSIWAAVSDNQNTHRVAVAGLSNPNRLPPESWSLRTIGTTASRATTLEVLAGRLYLGTMADTGTSSGLYYLAAGLWIPIPALSGKDVIASVASESTLVVCTSTQVYVVGLNNEVTELAVLPYSATSVTSGVTGEPVVGSLSGGLLTYEGTWQSRFPNGPNSNQFLSLAIDLEGNVWAASGLTGNGKGIYRFDGSGWISFTKENSALPTNDYYRVSIGCNGSVWASSWGWGIVEIPSGLDSIDASRIFSNNVGMEGLVGDTDYVVVTDVVCDPAGNTWMSVNSAGDGHILAVRLPDDSTWVTFPLKLGTLSLSTLLYNVPLEHTFAVDAFGSIWGGSRHTTYKGVFTLRNQSIIEDSIYTLLTDQDGLPSNDITTIVVDRDNDIWVGTERGIGIVLNPLDPEGPGGIAAYKPLNGIVVNSIAVDALNQKWVGTPDGVVLLSPDGVQQIASYTVENTGGRLIDNDIKSIAIDNASGTVYFGSPVGLSSLTTTSVAPNEEFDRLTISPNPYVVPSLILLSIDGLVENSTIKILSIDGKLIRELPSPGGRIGFWDGKSDDGKDVASGVYLVLAYSIDGSKIATGKVAVIRR